MPRPKRIVGEAREGIFRRKNAKEEEQELRNEFFRLRNMGELNPNNFQNMDWLEYAHPASSEQTLSSYDGYVPSSNAEAKAIAADEIRRDEVAAEQAAIQSRRMMQAQADREKVAAYEAALSQNRQAARRKESEQNARFAKAYNASARAEADKAAASQNRQAAQRQTVKRNQMDESQEGRPGGSYNNTKGVLKQGFDSVKLGKEMGGKKTSGDEVWYSKPKTSEPKQEEEKKPNWYTGNTSYKSGQKVGTVKKKGN